MFNLFNTLLSTESFPATVPTTNVTSITTTPNVTADPPLPLNSTQKIGMALDPSKKEERENQTKAAIKDIFCPK